ncbi:MAG TPA: 50S ribosomal protein L32 [Chloroflexia bacterium]|nr:50S ribosomal protein L32 [Chloroflexia bacterium]
MGATPKQRISRKRRGDRRSHHHLKPLHLVECPQCHNPRLPHHVCPSCGTYRGRQVLQVKEADSTAS